MKILNILFVFFLVATNPLNNCDAQNVISADAGYVYNIKKGLPGINVSTFYHFSEKFTAGLEMNRFFNNHPKKGEEEISISAWDFDMNFHYNIDLARNLFCYPLTGLSHTSEKETDAKGDIVFKRFYSFNTGAGVFVKFKKVVPFAEFMYTWGQMNQEFFLVGVGYEFELKKK